MPATISKKIGKKAGHPGIQGIRSNLDDLKIAGMNLKAVIGDAFVSGSLERSIAGASVLTLEVHDQNKHLLNSPLLTERHLLTLDGLAFSFTKVSQQGGEAPLALTYEPDVITRLRAVKGPRKAFRNKTTRALFAKSIVLAAKGQDIRFVCPELKVVQPIEDARSARDARRSAETERGKGLDGETHLPEKEGGAASASQRKLGDDALRIAESHNAPQRVMVALMEALLVESNLGELSSNILAGEGALGTLTHEQQIVGFLTGKRWTTEQGGAIGNFRRNPNARPWEIAQDVQASGAGLASHGRDNYGAVESEALTWVESFGGGSGSGGTTAPTKLVRYAFEQKPKESGWACITRLAKEVNWRCFESAGWIYFIAEPDLLAAVRRMTVHDAQPWLIDTSFDYDVGKPVSEMTVTALAHAWAAPPGSVAAVRDHGPANGPWLVSSISAPLEERDSLVEIKLKRPTEPLPEPAPAKAKTSTGRPTKPGEGGGAPAGAPAGIQTMIDFISRIDAKGWEYQWGGGHNASFSGPYDCSGFVSAVLHSAGLISEPVVSGTLAGMYQPGPGEWLTIYANGEHTFGKIRTAEGIRYFQSGGGEGSNPGGGGWTGPRSTSGFSVRHPQGY